MKSNQNMMLSSPRKERRSYIEKGLTPEQVERRNIVRGRLDNSIGRTSNEDDDNELRNIPTGSPRRNNFHRTAPRRSRSESRGPSSSSNNSNRRKERKRSLSASGLSDMRRSLLRSMSGSRAIRTNNNCAGKSNSHRTHHQKRISPPPSPVVINSERRTRIKTDDIMSNAIRRVQERRKKKMEETGVLIETFRMEDKVGGVHYYDSDDGNDDDSVDSSSSPNEVSTNIFYRGLQALEQIYLE